MASPLAGLRSDVVARLVGLKSIAASSGRKGTHRLVRDYVFDELQFLKRQLAQSPSRLFSAYELGCVTESGQYYVTMSPRSSIIPQPWDGA